MRLSHATAALEKIDLKLIAWVSPHTGCRMRLRHSCCSVAASKRAKGYQEFIDAISDRAAE
jgi:hypothetical protein